MDQEYCIDTGVVPTPRRHMVEHSVLGIVEKATTAIEEPAQVKSVLYKIKSKMIKRSLKLRKNKIDTVIALSTK